MPFKPKKLHFIAIGGVATASVAVLFKELGYEITGSDVAVYEPMAGYLKNNSIDYSDGFKAANVENKDLIIVGNAVSRGNVELEALLKNNLKFTSMPELLHDEILVNRRNIVIAGTHGKTTTSSLTAFLLAQGGLDPGYFVGGLIEWSKYNAVAGKDKSFFVLEGDEYDTAYYDKRSKFFHYSPEVFLINNLEFDHSDIFFSLADYKRNFSYALRLVPPQGLVLINGDDKNLNSIVDPSLYRLIKFGFEPHNDFIIENTKLQENGLAKFSLKSKNQSIELETRLYGKFNLQNCAAAAIIANYCGLSFDKIKSILPQFKAPKRRLSLLTSSSKLLIYDDFAHHPTAIYKTIEALKEHYPAKKIKIVYEPKSFTSLDKTHQNTLAGSFSLANSVYIVPPERWYKLDQDKKIDLELVIKQLNDNKAGDYQIFSSIRDLENELKNKANQAEMILILSQSNLKGMPLRLAEEFDNLYA